ncbi:MAG: hypothetical protein Fur0037_09790 [Planctomycetota bacterium]
MRRAADPPLRDQIEELLLEPPDPQHLAVQPQGLFARRHGRFRLVSGSGRHSEDMGAYSAMRSRGWPIRRSRRIARATADARVPNRITPWRGTVREGNILGIL